MWTMTMKRLLQRRSEREDENQTLEILLTWLYLHSQRESLFVNVDLNFLLCTRDVSLRDELFWSAHDARNRLRDVSKREHEIGKLSRDVRSSWIDALQFLALASSSAVENGFKRAWLHVHAALAHVGKIGPFECFNHRHVAETPQHRAAFDHVHALLQTLEHGRNRRDADATGDHENVFVLVKLKRRTSKRSSNVDVKRRTVYRLENSEEGRKTYSRSASKCKREVHGPSFLMCSEKVDVFLE
jgi:hypothetical protein